MKTVKMYNLNLLFALLLLFNVTVTADCASRITIGDFDVDTIAGGVVEVLNLTYDFIVFDGVANYPPKKDDIQFFAYLPGSANSTDYKQVVISDTDLKSKIDFTLPIGFVIHGWLDSFFGGFVYPTYLWMQDIGHIWSNNKYQNVICVHWHRLASHDYGITSIVNVPYVGKYVAKFIKHLIGAGAALENMQIVGHSLGAHVAGSIGAKLRGGIDIIFGLDPAGPLFSFPFTIGKAYRLDKSDARFVQVIHTNCNFLGSNDYNGHADYFVNGGALQPGCILDSHLPETIACSHERAIRLFKSSLTPGNGLIGQTCTFQPFCNAISSALTLSGTFADFLHPILIPVSVITRGFCPGKTDTFGLFTSKVKGKFYLTTTYVYPYY